MAFDTFPCNPYPISKGMLEKGNNDELNTRVTALEGEVSDLNSTKANQITIAPFFNAEASYSVGDLVYYNGLTYRCTNDHEGEWDADDFAATTVSNELATLKSGLTNKVDMQIYDEATSQSEDDAIKKLFDDINIYDKAIIGSVGYGGWSMFLAYKYAGGGYGSIVVFRYDGLAKFLSVYDNVKTIKTFTFGS